MYSSIDLSNEYLNILNDEQLQSLFCFELNGRRFTYMNLPQGWASSACLFHSKISSSRASLPCVSYVDGILIGDRTIKKHDANLGLVIQRLISMHLHVNEKKMQFPKKKILFLGYDV